MQLSLAMPGFSPLSVWISYAEMDTCWQKAAHGNSERELKEEFGEGYDFLLLTGEEQTSWGDITFAQLDFNI